MKAVLLFFSHLIGKWGTTKFFYLYSKKIIANNTINSLIKTIDMIKKRYKINQVVLSKEEIKFLARKIVKMPMLNYTSPKINIRDVQEFLRSE